MASLSPLQLNSKRTVGEFVSEHTLAWLEALLDCPLPDTALEELFANAWLLGRVAEAVGAALRRAPRLPTPTLCLGTRHSREMMQDFTAFRNLCVALRLEGHLPTYEDVQLGRNAIRTAFCLWDLADKCGALSCQGVPVFATAQERTEVRRCMSTATHAKRAQRFDQGPSPLKQPHRPYHLLLPPAGGAPPRGGSMAHSPPSVDSSASFHSWINSRNNSPVGGQSQSEDACAASSAHSAAGGEESSSGGSALGSLSPALPSPGGGLPMSLLHARLEVARATRAQLAAAEPTAGRWNVGASRQQRTPPKHSAQQQREGGASSAAAAAPSPLSPIIAVSSPESSASALGEDGGTPGLGPRALTPGRLANAAFSNPIYSPAPDGAEENTPPPRGPRAQGGRADGKPAPKAAAAEEESDRAADALLADLLSPAQFKSRSSQLIGALLHGGEGGAVSPSRFSARAAAAAAAAATPGASPAKSFVSIDATPAQPAGRRGRGRRNGGGGSWREPLLVAIGAVIAAGAAAAAAGVVGPARRAKRASPFVPVNGPHALTIG